MIAAYSGFDRFGVHTKTAVAIFWLCNCMSELIYHLLRLYLPIKAQQSSSVQECDANEA